MRKINIDEAITHILNGLTTDGAHHKQHDLEQALIALKGIDWVESQMWVDEEGNVIDEEKTVEEVYRRWEEGIPA